MPREPIGNPNDWLDHPIWASEILGCWAAGLRQNGARKVAHRLAVVDAARLKKSDLVRAVGVPLGFITNTRPPGIAE